MNAVKREFTIRNVKDTLQEVDQRLFDIVEELYARTIDFGGHPNERALTQSLSVRKYKGRTKFEVSYLLGDSLFLDHSMKTVAQIGLGSLCVFRHIFEERFEILGINHEINELRQTL